MQLFVFNNSTPTNVLFPLHHSDSLLIAKEQLVPVITHAIIAVNNFFHCCENTVCRGTKKASFLSDVLKGHCYT